MSHVNTSSASGMKTNQAEVLLDKYLASLAVRPVLTKGVTSGTVLATQEILSSSLTGVPVLAFLDRAIKMYLYGQWVETALGCRDQKWPKETLTCTPLSPNARTAGSTPWPPSLSYVGFLVAAPVGHQLTTTQQKVFAGKTGKEPSGCREQEKEYTCLSHNAVWIGLSWTILQMLTGNLIISPIQNSVYLMSMAVLAGRYRPQDLINAVRMGLYPMSKSARRGMLRIWRTEANLQQV